MVVRFPTQATLPECESLMGVNFTIPYAIRDIDNATATLIDEILDPAITEAQLETIRREAQRCWLSLAAVESSALSRMGRKES